VHFCATCDGPFYRGSKQLVVIGGGNSALEEGLFLTQFADRITLLERSSSLRASKLLQDKVRHHAQFDIALDTSVKSMSSADGKPVLELSDGSTLHPDGVFVFIGLDPNTKWLGADTVELDKWGFITTDAAFATSMPGVYAAGDVRAGATKQLGSAVGDGIAALIAIRSYLQDHADLRRVDVNA
jgi:thioredoxin reductase (NADPH)